MEYRISFNKPPYIGTEEKYIKEAVLNLKISGDGLFTEKCDRWFERETGSKQVLLTTSCTHALELAALALDIGPEDEIIMPSYTFVSTANAFVLRGAKIVFVDIRPDTMNIDEQLIEEAISPRTKAIVPVHYAGVSCDMDTIIEIAKRHHIAIIEDAAQGVLCYYKHQALGTFGEYGCYSFHETKNYSMGEGGAILINGESDGERIEIMREKGTDRKKFFRGQVDKYSWVDKGSSYLPSDLNAAYLWAQLENSQLIFDSRMNAWNRYNDALKSLSENGKICLPYIPKECEHNAHMFYIKVKDMEERTALIHYLSKRGIQALFHYIPLHTSPAGEKNARFSGEDVYTTKESERLVRLPMYYGISNDEVDCVVDSILAFYKE